MGIKGERRGREGKAPYTQISGSDPASALSFSSLLKELFDQLFVIINANFLLKVRDHVILNSHARFYFKNT